jgi:hypothetical protein
MLRLIVIIGVLAAATPSHADPAPHPTGVWLELAIDSNLGGASTGVDDMPSHHLVIGAATGSLALGLELGFQYATPSWRADVGPTARFTLAATSDRDTELVAEAGVIVSIFGADSGNGAPNLYTVQAGFDARHWFDRHIAVGGGILGHVQTQSDNGASALGLGLAGAVRVTAVF